jgi:hypothetical protein
MASLSTDIDLSQADTKHITKDQLIDLIGRLQITKAEGSALVGNNEPHNVASSLDEVKSLKIMVENLSKEAEENRSFRNLMLARLTNTENNSAGANGSSPGGPHTVNLPGGEHKDFAQASDAKVGNSPTPSNNPSAQTPLRTPQRQHVNASGIDGNASGSATQHNNSTPSSSFSHGPGSFGRSPISADNSFDAPAAQPMITLEIKDSLPASKDYQLKVKDNGIKPDDFYLWYTRIGDVIESSGKFRALTIKNLAESYRAFGWNYSGSVKDIHLQQLFLTAHCKLWGFLIECLPTYIRLEITNLMKSNPSTTNIPAILNFTTTSHSHEVFYRNCAQLLNVLHKRYFSASVLNEDEIMEELDNLKCGENEDPREFLVKWKNLHTKLTMCVQGYQPPPERLQVRQVLRRLPKCYQQLNVEFARDMNTMNLEDLINWAGNIWLMSKSSNKSKSKPGKDTKTPKESANPAFSKNGGQGNGDKKRWGKDKGKPYNKGKQNPKPSSTPAAAESKSSPADEENWVCFNDVLPLDEDKEINSDESDSPAYALPAYAHTHQNRPNVNQFIYDTGATVHLTGNPRLLDQKSIKQSVTPIKIVSISGTTKSRQEGALELNERITLGQVRVVPGSDVSLVSGARLAEAGLISIVTSKAVYIISPRALLETSKLIKKYGTVMTFKRVGNLYVDDDFPADGKKFAKTDVTFKDIKPQQADQLPVGVPANAAPSVKPGVHIPKKNAGVSASKPSSAPLSFNSSSSSAAPNTAAVHNVTFEEEATSIDDDGEFAEEFALNNSVEELSNVTEVDGIQSSISPETPSSETTEINVGTQASSTPTRLDDTTLWHNRLGHGSIESFNKTAAQFSLGIKPIENNDGCLTCITNKAHRAPINHKVTQPIRVADAPMVKWCVDLIGPISEIDPNDKDKKIQIPSIDGHSYMLVMVDEFSRCTMVAPIHHKFDAIDVIINLVKLWQNCTGRKLVRLHSDGGKEFINSGLESFLKDNGTELTTTTPDTPEFNGLVERMNQQLVTMARCMLNHSNSPPHLWSHAIMYASHIYNNSVQPSNGGHIPITLMDKNRKPTLDHIKVFGSDCHVLVARRGKLSKRTQPAVFIGFSAQYGTHKVLLENSSGKLTTKATRDVKVIETQFNHVDNLKSKIIDAALNAKIAETEYDVESIVSHKFDKNGKILFEVKWKDYPETSFERTSKLTNCSDKLVKYLLPIAQNERINFANEDFAFAANTVYTDASTVNEPQTYKEALNHPNREQWLMAIQSELQSLDNRDVFTPVELPKNAKAIPCRWVFKAKLDSNNQIARHKARLVVKGYHQRAGEDFDATYSPTVGYQSIKLLLQFAATKDWEVKQLDFDTAFLNATLNEDIYVKIPEGFDRSTLPPGCNALKVNKTLYGLRQAARNWHLEFHDWAISRGYTASELDPCVYIKTVGGHRIYMTIWVDDVLTFFPACIAETWEADKADMAARYNIKDLGDVQWILNMKLVRDRAARTITLSQQAYIDRMVSDYRMQDCKPAKNPFEYQDLTVPPGKQSAIPLNSYEHEQYRSIVGLLLYASIITRIDISFITSSLARYVAKPMNYHLTAARRVLRYLKGQNDYQLLFGPSNKIHSNNRIDPFDVTIYTDSDWAQERDDRKSNGGWILMVNGRPIVWQCKKQKTTALSSSEAELYSLVEGVREALYIKQWLEFYMNRDPSLSVTIKCDNSGANEMADHKTDHGRTKHIDLRYFFVREHVAKQSIKMIYVPTNENLADLLTKPVNQQTFIKFRDQLLTKDNM